MTTLTNVDILEIYKIAGKVYKKSRMPSHIDIEDFQQDCVEAALKSVDAILGANNKTAMLYSVVRYALLKILEKEGKNVIRRGNVVDIETQHQIEDVVAANSFITVERMYELEQLVANANNNLNSIDFFIIRSIFNGRTSADIAMELGITPARVSQRLKKTLKNVGSKE